MTISTIATVAPQPDEVELSIVMPCLNESRTLATCIDKAMSFLERNGIEGEVIVADNGSTDGSQELAIQHGARVLNIPRRGYGSALQGGIAAARGRYIIMGDSDDSYDFSSLSQFVEKLRDGYDLVMGNRFEGGVQPGAMPPLHRYFGNPFLTGIGRLFFKSQVRDFYCGLRGFSRAAAQRMDLRTTGMEFALEMVVKARFLGMRVTEVPITLWPDGRDRPPHLRSWRDGWRSLRFFLLYSPRWLFLYPGILLMLVGMAGVAWLLPSPRAIGTLGLDYHSLLYFAAFVIVGYQSALFAVLSRFFAVGAGLLPDNPTFSRVTSQVSLEIGLLVGGLLVLAGIAGSVYAVVFWESVHFGPLMPRETLRVVIPSITALIIGSETILASFFLSVLALARR
jgi:glycosyltransferase involved in cell wall biosynthesis